LQAHVEEIRTHPGFAALATYTYWNVSFDDDAILMCIVHSLLQLKMQMILQVIDEGDVIVMFRFW
jgi:hypothetical protein